MTVAKKPSSPKRRTKATAEGLAPTVRVKEEPKAKPEGYVFGRPTLYTEEIAAEICMRLAKGETLNQICRSEHMPARTTVVEWVLEDRSGLSDRYARSRDLQIEHWADEVLDIADDATNDYMERSAASDDEKSSWSLNGEHVQRSRLRIDSRKWLLSKLKPDQYGDKLQHGGDKGNPINHQVGGVIEFHVIDNASEG